MDERTLRGKKVCITGAAGFTGRHAVQYFHKIGAHVTGIVRTTEKYASKPDGVKLLPCDINDEHHVQQVMDVICPDYVLHLAAKNEVSDSWKNPLLYVQANMMSLLYVLQALRKYEHARILVVGSQLAYRLEKTGLYDPPHPYSFSKMLANIASLCWKTLFSQQIIIAEPTNLIGTGPSKGLCTRLADHIVNCELGNVNEPFCLSRREDTRDFLDVRDAVRAYACILKYGVAGEVYPVVSGQKRELGYIVDAMLQMSCASVPIAWNCISSEEKPQVPADVALPDWMSQWRWKPQFTILQSVQQVLEYARSRQ